MINKTYILDTDASHSAIGCVLSQIQDGTERVISYCSKKLSKSERAYCVMRKELLSINFFVQFLLGTKFILILCSWIAELKIYDLEIKTDQIIIMLTLISFLVRLNNVNSVISMIKTPN